MTHEPCLQARAWAIHLLQTRLEPRFEYHDLRHTLAVEAVCARYADHEALPPAERRLLLTAAIGHDLGFIESAADHEAHGARLCRAHLPAFGFTPPEVDAIARLILATRMPQRPAGRLEEIICDADLDHLGRDDFWELNARLRREWAALGRVWNEPAWLDDQIAFLKNHCFFRPVARLLRDPGKGRNLLLAEQRLRALRAPAVEH